MLPSIRICALPLLPVPQERKAVDASWKEIFVDAGPVKEVMHSLGDQNHTSAYSCH